MCKARLRLLPVPADVPRPPPARPRSIPAAQRHFTVVLAEQVTGARPLGVRQVERCLPVGTMLTAVGELNAAVEHPSAFKVRRPSMTGRRQPSRVCGRARRCAMWPRMPASAASACTPAVHTLLSTRRALLCAPRGCDRQPSALPIDRSPQGAVRRGGKMLVLRPPRDGPFVFSRQPLPELIASLQATSTACQQWATVFTAVGATMLVAAATQHAATWLRRRSIRRRVEKALRQRQAAPGQAGAAACAPGGAAGAASPAAASSAVGQGSGDAGGGLAGGLCVVCLEHSPDTVFPSCGHLCACSRCAASLARCPICRSRGRPIRVYTP